MKPSPNKSILNCTVSMLRCYADLQPVDVNLLDFLTNDNHKTAVAQIRATVDRSTRSQLKAKLPAVTVSGRFSARGEKNLIEHSGLIAFDLDNVEDLEAARQVIIKSPYVAYLGLSASGNGLFGIISISDPEKHKQHFQAMEKYFERLGGFKIDPAPANVASLRGYSYDPMAYFNHSPEVFTKLYTKPVRTAGSITMRPNAPLKQGPFEAYKMTGNIPALLIAHGWQFLHQKGPNIRFSRPGKNFGVSADYSTELKRLYVFSSSTAFEPGKSYDNIDVFRKLECGDDFKLCRQKLLEMGY